MSLSERFLTSHPPDRPRIYLDDAQQAALSERLSPKLVTLLTDCGVGTHRRGLLQLINPLDYIEIFASFFGGDASGRMPFMINGFAEIVAAKSLPGREVEISILHTYGPKLEVLALSVEDFVESVLGEDDGLGQVINYPLFEAVATCLPRLLTGQSYGFDPQVLATAEPKPRVDASYFELVDTHEHLSLLLKRAQED